MPPRKARSEEAAIFRRQIREWIRSVISRFETDPQEIAQKSGVNAGTLYRWLREDNEISPRMDSVMRVAAAYGVSPPGVGAPARGFAESEAAPYTGPLPPDMPALTPNQSLWRIGSRALELIGVMPGDILLLDQAAPARQGDIVIAQIYNLERGTAETKVRYFDGIYLQTRTMDPGAEERPVMAVGERAAIAGRVLRLSRTMG